MRLIDADKIRYRDLSGGQVPDGVWHTFLDDVEKVPTVKAIPIKWLKQWFERQVWQGSSPTDRIHCKASDIIEDWERENDS